MLNVLNVLARTEARMLHNRFETHGRASNRVALFPTSKEHALLLSFHVSCEVSPREGGQPKWVSFDAITHARRQNTAGFN